MAQRTRLRDRGAVTQREESSGSGVFHAVRRQADSEATMEHVTPRHTHINTVTVFRAVRPETV
jgi:hypothetical protein